MAQVVEYLTSMKPWLQTPVLTKIFLKYYVSYIWYVILELLLATFEKVKKEQMKLIVVSYLTPKYYQLKISI
jgi:hypothetical protein